MTKRLSERVFARIKINAKRSINHNAVVFSALHGEIVEALNDGCSLKSIWETLYEEGKVSFKFDAFLRHAKKSNEISKIIGSIKGKKSSCKEERVMLSKPTSTRLLPKETKSISTKIAKFEIDPTKSMEDFK